MTKWSFAGMTALICVHIWLAKPAITIFSPTYDEPVHLTAGVTYWKTGDYRYNGYHHPPLGEMWAALPVLLLKPVLPVHHSTWIKQAWSPLDQYLFADVFLFKNRVSAEKMMSYSRWMQVALSCLLGAIIILAAWQLGGMWAAFLAGLFWSLSPAFLANGTLVSTDLAFTCFFFGYFAFLARRPDNPVLGAIVAGVCLGAAFGSKYFALSLIPITCLLLMVDSDLRKQWKSWLIILGTGLLSLALIYQFTGLDVFWKGLMEIFTRSQSGRSSFFMGNHGSQGWLHYFPVLFLVKTPLPLLIGIAVALNQVARKKLRIPAALWIPPSAFFLVACLSKVQIGHRHILVIYPFLIVMAGLGIHSLLGKKIWASIPLFIWLAIQTVLSRPHFLPYFNEIIGGPTQGYKYFTDSNVDWGQGLKELGESLTEEDKSKGIYLSYFGVVDPHEYGIRYLDLGSDRIVPRVDDSVLMLSPSKLAISVTNLQGTYYSDHAAFGWLKKYEPVKIIGHSIFLYDFSNQPEAMAEIQRMRT